MAKKLRTGETTNLGFIRALKERGADVKFSSPAETMRDELDSISSKKVTFQSTNETVVEAVNTSEPGPGPGPSDRINLTLSFLDSETGEPVSNFNLIVNNDETGVNLFNGTVAEDRFTISVEKNIRVYYDFSKDGYDSLGGTIGLGETDAEQSVTVIKAIPHTAVTLVFRDSETDQELPEVSFSYCRLSDNSGMEIFNLDNTQTPVTHNLVSNATYSLVWDGNDDYADGSISFYVGNEPVEMRIGLYRIPEEAAITIPEFRDTPSGKAVSANVKLTNVDTGDVIANGSYDYFSVVVPTKYTYRLDITGEYFIDQHFEFYLIRDNNIGTINLDPNYADFNIQIVDASGESMVVPKIEVIDQETGNVVNTFDNTNSFSVNLQNKKYYDFRFCFRDFADIVVGEFLDNETTKTITLNPQPATNHRVHFQPIEESTGNIIDSGNISGTLLVDNVMGVGYSLTFDNEAGLYYGNLMDGRRYSVRLTFDDRATGELTDIVNYEDRVIEVGCGDVVSEGTVTFNFYSRSEGQYVTIEDFRIENEETGEVVYEGTMGSGGTSDLPVAVSYKVIANYENEEQSTSFYMVAAGASVYLEFEGPTPHISKGTSFIFYDNVTQDRIHPLATIHYEILDGAGTQLENGEFSHDLSEGELVLETTVEGAVNANVYFTFSNGDYIETEPAVFGLTEKPYNRNNLGLDPTGAPEQYTIRASAINGEGVKYEGQNVRFTLDGRLAGESTFNELDAAETESGEYAFINDVGTYDEYEALRVSARLVGTNMEGHTADLTVGSDSDVSITLDYRGVTVTVLDADSGGELSNIDEVTYTFFNEEGSEVESGDLHDVSSPFDIETDSGLASSISLTINSAGYMEETSDCSTGLRPNYPSTTVELSPEEPGVTFTANVIRDVAGEHPEGRFTLHKLVGEESQEITSFLSNADSVDFVISEAGSYGFSYGSPDCGFNNAAYIYVDLSQDVEQSKNVTVRNTAATTVNLVPDDGASGVSGSLDVSYIDAANGIWFYNNSIPVDNTLSVSIPSYENELVHINTNINGYAASAMQLDAGQAGSLNIAKLPDDGTTVFRKVRVSNNGNNFLVSDMDAVTITDDETGNSLEATTVGMFKEYGFISGHNNYTASIDIPGYTNGSMNVPFGISKNDLVGDIQIFIGIPRDESFVLGSTYTERIAVYDAETYDWVEMPLDIIELQLPNGDSREVEAKLEGLYYTFTFDRNVGDDLAGTNLYIHSQVPVHDLSLTLPGMNGNDLSSGDAAQVSIALAHNERPVYEVPHTFNLTDDSSGEPLFISNLSIVNSDLGETIVEASDIGDSSYSLNLISGYNYDIHIESKHYEDSINETISVGFRTNPIVLDYSLSGEVGVEDTPDFFLHLPRINAMMYDEPETVTNVYLTSGFKNLCTDGSVGKSVVVRFYDGNEFSGTINEVSPDRFSIIEGNGDGDDNRLLCGVLDINAETDEVVSLTYYTFPEADALDGDNAYLNDPNLTSDNGKELLEALDPEAVDLVFRARDDYGDEPIHFHLRKQDKVVIYDCSNISASDAEPKTFTARYEDTITYLVSIVTGPETGDTSVVVTEEPEEPGEEIPIDE